MSKKHLIALARAISTIRDRKERERTGRLIADVCAAFNGRFDRGRFLWACGMQQTEGDEQYAFSYLEGPSVRIRTRSGR